VEKLVATPAGATVLAAIAAAAAIATEIAAVAGIAESMSDLRITQLGDTGLTVVTERVPTALSVAAGVWVAVGSRDEPDDVAGVSHFLEHLLFKGTPTRSAQDISRSVDRVGGDFNAFTTKEYTAYYCRVPARHQQMCIDLLGDVLTRPLIDDADVAREAQVILEELAMDDDSPDDVAHRLFTERVFAGHPLGRDTAGRRDAVRAMTAAQVREFYEASYHAASMVVTIAGPHDHDEMVGLVEAAFGDVRSGGEMPEREAPATIGASLSVDDDTEQVHIVVGGRALRRRHPHREALDVVNHVLGGGLSSRLFDEIRERRGLAYSVYSGVSAYSDAGAFQMYAGTQVDQAPQVVELMVEQVASLSADGITDEELDVARGYLTGAFELGLEDTGARMARNGALMLSDGEIRPISDQVARWAAVDQQAVGDVISEVFSGELITVTVGPH
jgi:predicted Zn-dependent peptidase